MILHIENLKDATRKLLINSVRLQDTKLIYRYLLNFCSLTVKENINNYKI